MHFFWKAPSEFCQSKCNIMVKVITAGKHLWCLTKEWSFWSQNQSDSQCLFVFLIHCHMIITYGCAWSDKWRRLEALLALKIRSNTILLFIYFAHKSFIWAEVIYIVIFGFSNNHASYENIGEPPSSWKISLNKETRSRGRQTCCTPEAE